MSKTIVLLALIFSTVAGPTLTAQATDAPACKSGDVKRLEVSYDDIKDETYATMIVTLPSLNLFSGVQDGFLIQTRHAGQASDSVLVPRMWLIGRMGSLDPLESVVNVLIEDSVRYAWKSEMAAPSFGGNGIYYGMGADPVTRKYLEIPAQEFTRLATADHASLAINGRRYNFKAKELARFAAIDAWSRCLSARQTRSGKK